MTTKVAEGRHRAGIIAAGRGDRLRDGTHTLKPLVPIAGRTLIEHVLASIAETAPSEVVIIVNEASLAVKEHVTSRRWPFTVQWIVETTPSSMHSFLRVLEALAPGGPDDDDGPFLMSTVDTIATPGAYASFLAASREREGDVTLALGRPGNDENPLLARLAPGTSRIEAMGEQVRLEPNFEADLWATTGYYAVRPTILREAEGARRDKLPALRTFFTRLVSRGYRLIGIPVAGAVDVDRPGDVQTAEAFLKQVGA